MPVEKPWLIVVRYSDDSEDESGPFSDRQLIEQLRGWRYALESNDDPVTVEIRVLVNEE